MIICICKSMTHMACNTNRNAGLPYGQLSRWIYLREQVYYIEANALGVGICPRNKLSCGSLYWTKTSGGGGGTVADVALSEN